MTAGSAATPHSIRRAESPDRAAVEALVAGTGAFKAHEVPVAMEVFDVALTQGGTGDDYRSFVLVEDDGTVAAWASVGKNPMTVSTWDYYWLATRADRQGKGYGRAISDFVEGVAKADGATLLVIETSSQESYGSTRRFFESIGYHVAATLPGYYAPGDDKIVYLKPLG